MRRVVCRTLIFFIFIALIPAKGDLSPRTDHGPWPLQFRSGGHVLGFLDDAVVVASGSHAFRVEFVSPRPVKPEAATPSGQSTEPTGGAPALGRVVYRELWDGVSAVYEGAAGAVVKSTYHVRAAGGSASIPADAIRLRYNVPVEIDEDGSLAAAFPAGVMRESRPVAWQEIDGAKVPVDVAYRLTGEREVGFAVGAHDTRHPLVIDPTLRWNTFLGSASDDQGYAIAVDSNRNSYITGWSLATWGTPVRSYRGQGSSNAFVAKLNSSGALVWNTFLGDDYMAEGAGIAVDAGGNSYIIGRSYTWWTETPVRSYTGSDGVPEAFVAKLSPTGSLLWHTFLGGTAADYGQGIAVDGSGNSYVTGTSYTTWGAPRQAYAGNAEAFAAKLGANGALLWNTFMGQANIDFGLGLAIDAGGNSYVTGYSYYVWGNPVAPWSGASGFYNAFVAKLDTDGYRAWNTFLGGTQYDYGYGIAADAAGNSYVTGFSWSTWGTPVRPFGGYRDGFVAKLNTNGALQWNTFLGGTNADFAYAIDIDGGGQSYVAGLSNATWGTPVRPYSGGDDAFAAKLDASGGLVWNAFLGGASEDCGKGVAADESGNAYVTGYSDWGWGSPVRPYSEDPDDVTYEAFVASVGGGVRVDFDKDGQEDILWRYQGEGGFQGLILAWLMDQTLAGAPAPLAERLTEAEPTSLLTGTTFGAASRIPRPVEIARGPFKAPKGSFKFLMLDGKAPVLKAGQVMQSPLEARRGRSPWTLGVGAVAVIAVVVAGFLAVRGRGEGNDPAGERPTAMTAGARPVRGDKSIIVLPFENLGPPEDAYFAAGITDEIVTSLTDISVFVDQAAMDHAEALLSRVLERFAE